MDELYKFFDKHRVKLRAAVFFKFIDSVFHRKRLFIRTFGSHCIKTVCNGENPCHIRNILAGKSAGITGAVITFMVADNGRDHVIHVRQIADHLCGIFHMRFHNSIFLISKL